MSKLTLTADQLDKQCPIKIDRWIDIHSDEAKSLPDYSFTKKCIRLLLGDGLYPDTNGRLWGKGDDGSYYPFHNPIGKRNVGYRISSKAAN